MIARKAVLGGLSAAAAALLLAGCTSDGDGDKAQDGASGSATKAVSTPGGVLAEQTVDAPHFGQEASHGGTMTVTVRSVVASEGRTALAWAIRWDDPEAADEASVYQNEFTPWGSNPPVLVDGTGMKIYYPLCPGRDWHDTVSSIFCGDKALFLPRLNTAVQFVNHQTLEAWAVFPEVGKDTKTVDLTLPPGFPEFSSLPVTRS